jgi:hypothetical protein
MSLTPISKQELHDLKAKKDDETRRNAIQAIITRIYETVKRLAETTGRTVYRDPLPLARGPSPPGSEHILTGSQLYRLHFEDIVTELKQLFPGCKVEYGSNTHGLSIPVDVEEYLLIDWS